MLDVESKKLSGWGLKSVPKLKTVQDFSRAKFSKPPLKVLKIHRAIALESLLTTSDQTRFLNLEHQPEKISGEEFASGPWHLGAMQIRAR